MSKFYVMFFLLSISLNSYAYLDPGTGSVIIQAIIGGIAAVGVIVKIYWYKILRFFRIIKKDKKN